MPSRKIFAFFTPQKIHSQQLYLEKVHTRSQTVTRSAEEVTYGFSRGFKSSEEAEMAYPP